MKHLPHHDRNNQSWLRKWSLTQVWWNIYHKLNHIFRLVLCCFEGSQSGNNDNVILDMARHHLPTDFLVFRYGQIQPCVCILNLPRGENTQSSGVGTKTFRCPSPSYKPKKINAKALTGTGHHTDPAPNTSYSVTRLTGTWPVSYIPSQSTCHEPLQAAYQEHIISVKRCGFTQNGTSLAGAESPLSPPGRWEDPMISHQVYFETKVCS